MPVEKEEISGEKKTSLPLYVIGIVIPSVILLFIFSNLIDPGQYELKMKAMMTIGIVSFIAGIITAIIFTYIERDRLRYMLAGIIASVIAGCGNFVITVFAKSRFMALVEQQIMRIPPGIASVDSMVPNPWVMLVIIIASFTVPFAAFALFRKDGKQTAV